ncbi:MAG: DUF3783 domain-containing protein [Desulfomonilia bacterium]|nr:DUF3783 domain-containing protein [Desulfomonilia bacterium]
MQAQKLDMSPRILIWGYTGEVQEAFYAFLGEIGAPPAVSIPGNRGCLFVHEILFSDKESEKAFSCDEKVVLFFNVEAQMVHKVMNEGKKRDLPRPIYAMVTRQNIEWTFDDLVEHLVKERDFITEKKRQRNKERAGGHS